MAEISITIPNKVPVKYLKVVAAVRYWEDAEVNGVQDDDGKLIPFGGGDYWVINIDLETGQITDWPKGTVASVHYKVCDDGDYTLYDRTGRLVKRIEGYVPNILCPRESGYGDYIIMDIDQDGFIQGWKVDLSCFEDDR